MFVVYELLSILMVEHETFSLILHAAFVHLIFLYPFHLHYEFLHILLKISKCKYI